MNYRKLVFCAPSIGASSQTWMHRQIVGMREFAPYVLTYKYENQDTYPLDNIPLTIVPESKKSNKVTRVAQRIVNSAISKMPFDGTRAELKVLVEGIRGSDIVLAQFGPVGLRLLPVCSYLHIPLFVHFHGFDLSQLLTRSSYVKHLKNNLFKFAGCICVASYQKNWLLNHGADESNVHLIPCGTPLPKQSLRNIAAPTDTRRFIMVGRLTEKKRPDLTIKAFAKCIHSGADAQLTIVGDGKMRSQCESIIKKARITDRVRWMGAMSNEEVKQELLRSDVFVQHSVRANNGDMEGWPVAIAEASAFGLAVIATRHAGIVDQVDNDVTGYLVEEGDWYSMAEKMMKLCKEVEIAKQMGIAGMQKMQHVSTEIQISKLEAVLKRYL